MLNTSKLYLKELKLKFSHHLVIVSLKESQEMFNSPGNISGASQLNSITAFSWTAAVDGDSFQNVFFLKTSEIKQINVSKQFDVCDPSLEAPRLIWRDVIYALDAASSSCTLTPSAQQLQRSFTLKKKRNNVYSWMKQRCSAVQLHTCFMGDQTKSNVSSVSYFLKSSTRRGYFPAQMETSVNFNGVILAVAFWIRCIFILK